MRSRIGRVFSILSGLLLAPAIAAAQGITVTGRVTSDQNIGLSGANISIAELGVGATSREDGRYTITIPGARVSGQAVTITARRVGHRVQSHRITLAGGNITQDFTLAANPMQLGEIVVTGAGTTIEAEKLGNVRNFVAPELIVKSNESNVVQALAGKAPNVNVSASAGDPGAASKIQIRGLRTLNGNFEPLFIVDGIPVNNSTFSTTNLNPIDAGGGGVGGQDNGGEFEGTSAPNRMIDMNSADIENVEILKGAAAAAIYGARAANGVILITTKRGRAGATQYSMRSSMTADKVSADYPLQRKYAQGFLNVNTLFTRSWGAEIPAGTPSFDHWNEALVTGHQFDNTLTASGGNERTTFYLSGNYNHNRGVFVGPNNFFERSTLRLNASHKLVDNLSVRGNVAYADTRGNFTQRGNNVNGLLLGLLRTPPDFNNQPYLDPTSGLHRSYMLPNADITTAGQSRTFNNPFFTLHEQVNQGQASRTFGNFSAEYLANSWLRFNYTLGADYSNDERLEGCPQECSDVATGGRITEGKVINYEIDHNLTGTANWTVNEDVKGTFTAGQNLNSRNYRTMAVVGRTLIVPQPFSLLNTLTRDPPSDFQTVIHNESYFGQLTVDLFDQLYLTGALRNDGSTTFGRDNRRTFFPKASASWTFTNMYKPSFITFGKLRTSYGEAGNEPQPYLTSATFSGTNLLGGITQGTGFTPTQGGVGGLVNTFTKPAVTLKPERTRETEVGFDVGFWKDKADLSYTYYFSETKDVILVTPIAPSTGFSSEAKNAGIFENQGAEISLNLRPITTPTYSWSVGAGWGRNMSLVKNIAGAEFLYTNNFFFIPTVAMEGQPMGVYRGFGWIRCGISDDVTSYPFIATDCAGKAPGTLYIDDGSNCSAEPGMPCGDDNPRIMGNPNPQWTGNVNSTFKYKKFELSGLMDIRKGGIVWNGTRGALWSYGTHKETETRAICVDDGAGGYTCTGNEQVFGSANWFPGPVAGPGANTPVPIGQNWYHLSGVAACPFTGYDDPCLEDGSFVKLRELSLGYTFDQPWVQRTLGMSTVDVRVSGRNLKTWTDYKGLDPETSVGGPFERVSGADYFNLPLTRSFVFSFTLNR